MNLYTVNYVISGEMFDGDIKDAKARMQHKSTMQKEYVVEKVEFNCVEDMEDVDLPSGKSSDVRYYEKNGHEYLRIVYRLSEDEIDYYDDQLPCIVQGWFYTSNKQQAMAVAAAMSEESTPDWAIDSIREIPDYERIINSLLKCERIFHNEDETVIVRRGYRDFKIVYDIFKLETHQRQDGWRLFERGHPLKRMGEPN